MASRISDTVMIAGLASLFVWCVLQAGCHQSRNQTIAYVSLTDHLIETSHKVNSRDPNRITLVPGGVRMGHYRNLFVDVLVRDLRTSDDMWALGMLSDMLSNDPSEWIVATSESGQPIRFESAVRSTPPGVLIQPRPAWMYFARLPDGSITGVVPVHVMVDGRTPQPGERITITLLDGMLDRAGFETTTSIDATARDFTVNRIEFTFGTDSISPSDLAAR